MNKYLDMLQADKMNNAKPANPTPNKLDEYLSGLLVEVSTALGDIIQHLDDSTGEAILAKLVDIHAAQVARANDEVVFNIDYAPNGCVQRIRATRVMVTAAAPPLLLA